MWKIIKKILRTIALWLPLFCMIVNVFAIDGIETIPLHNYISMSWSSESAIQGSALAYDTLPNIIMGQTTTTRLSGALYYQSAIEKNKFYHMRMELKANNATSRTWIDDLATGVITDQGGEVSTVMLPANSLSPYITAIENSYQTKTYQSIDMSWNKMSNYKITSYVGAKAYYYFTKGANGNFILDAVMYFNDEFFDYGWSFDASSTRYMQCYIGMFMPMSGAINLLNVDVYEVSGSDYNGKLDQIIALLQAQGGGLSREDIQAATLAALEQHDAAEQQHGNAAINDAQNQLNGAFSPYIQNLESIKNAFNGFTSALSYSGTGCLITFPAAINPMTNTELWGQGEINLAYYYNQIPPALRYLIKASLSALIFYSVILEVIDTIRRITGVSDND